MKKFFLIFPIFALAACGPEKTGHIKGTLSGTNAEMVYLQELGGSNRTATKDSVKLDANGSFSFKYKISQPTFYSFTANQQSISLLAHPGEKITISGDTHQLAATYDVKGSEDSKYICQLNHRLNQTTTLIDSLNTSLQTYLGNRNFANIQRQFEWNIINEVDSLHAFNVRFIEHHPNSLVIIYALYQQIRPEIYLFSDEEDIKYFRVADSLFYKKYPKVSYVKSLHANLVEMNEKHRIKQLNRMLSMLGKDAPEIALPSPNGQMMKLSANRGKYVLIDFWASWSAPCRTENHNLVDAYHKYHTKGFDIFQVSLDQSKSSWERAIKEDGLAWIHVSDFKFWDSDVVKIYGVETIPANFLIDKEGTIIAKDLKGDALDKKLSELFAAAK